MKVDDIEEYLHKKGLRLYSYTPDRQRLYQIGKIVNQQGAMTPLTEYMTFRELKRTIEGMMLAEDTP